jgi:hypothetical protein
MKFLLVCPVALSGARLTPSPEASLHRRPLLVAPISRLAAASLSVLPLRMRPAWRGSA